MWMELVLDEDRLFRCDMKCYYAGMSIGKSKSNSLVSICLSVGLPPPFSDVNVDASAAAQQQQT